MERRRRLVLVGVIVLALPALALPALAAARPRPNAPKKGALAAELAKLRRGTPFAEGKAAIARAERAVRQKKLCRASGALQRYDGIVVKRLAIARGKRQRAALRRRQARGARANALVLRSLPLGKSCGGLPTFAVDSALKPAKASLPGLGGSGPRPLARIADAYGNEADFVANELVLVTADEQELNAFVARWKGKVLTTNDLSKLDPASKLKQYLVRVNVARADLGSLAADAQQLSKTRGGVGLVSSESGLGTLAAAAGEASDGAKVGVNWVGEGAAIASGSTLEAPNGPDGFSTAGSGWSRDAFTWKHLSAGSTQAVGVPSAWQLLARTGRSANRIGLAILDMGYAPATNGPDFGPIDAALSNVPFTAAIGTANLLGCSGGGGCPWHGTNVANTAFAVVDDGLGVAGTGGPVARRIVVFTLYDYITSIAAVIQASVAGARIVNMSYGADVPAVFSWTVIPFEIATGIARAGGMLLFAAAGNSNTDVDATDCFIICWEETLWTPCENVGVFCVGALDHDSVSRAGYSNYGQEGVNLFAPGTVLVGLDPQFPISSGQSGVHSVNGTSFASPYLAGVAALVWAAEPVQSATDVERALLETARTSPDGNVRRYVHALAAVKRPLPRVLEIEQPANGASFRRGTSVGFSAFVYDDDLGAPSGVTWRLGDGTVIGSGLTFSTLTLPYGAQHVAVSAAFPDGATLTDAIDITLTNDPPTVAIQQPTTGQTFFESENLSLIGNSADVNQPESSFRLRDSQLAWLLDGATTPTVTGSSATLDLNPLSLGVHTLTLRGTDDQGATATASITFTVAADPPNLPPSVSITSPANLSSFQVEFTPEPGSGLYYKDVAFTATATDPEGQPMTFEWTEVVNNVGSPTVRSTALSPTIRLRTPDGCPSQHDLTLKVTDSATNVRTATVRVFLDIPC